MPYLRTLRLAGLFFLSLALTPSGLAQGDIFPGLVGEELRLALTSYAPSQVLSEAAAKDTLYAVIDRASVDGVDGTVGLYTGLFVPFDCDPSCDPSQDVYNNGSGINQEHVWPRSFGAGSGNAERDMHHLFPTRVVVNSARGNLPFGESPDEETTSWYYLDETEGEPPAEERDLWSELLGSVRFEPREEKKGDVARALFYFYSIYGPDGAGQADEAFFEGMKETLLAWHEGDLPTAEEVARSERVAQYQVTGSGEPAINPFVHDASLARRAFFGPVLFVRQGNDLDPALQTGASWASAIDDLQDALAVNREEPVRRAVTQVWVAEGTYYPTDDGATQISFELDVSLYGGFAGTESSIEERDWEAHPTVLSGDLGVPGDYADNSRFVVEVASTALERTLDGFVVAGAKGATSGSFPLYWGAGLLVRQDGEVAVRRCLFKENAGRGITSLYGSEVQLEDVRFEANKFGFLSYEATTTGEDLVWVHNELGVTFAGGSGHLERVRFTENAGAISVGTETTSVAAVSVLDAVFERGGPFDLPPIGAVPARTVVNVFRGSLTLVNALFEGNELHPNTAPVTLAFANAQLANVAFVGNHGGRSGMLSAYYDDVNADLVNVTATRNSGSEAGSVLVREYDHDIRIESSVVWDNGQPEVHANGYGLHVALDHTLFDGGCEPDDTVSCESVLNEDPLFVRAPSPGDDGEWGTEDDDYGDLHLQEGSPAVDFGLAEYLPPDTFDLDGDGDTEEPLPYDLAGEARVQASEVDLGAYESPFAVSNEPVAGVPTVDRLSAAYPNPFRSRAVLTLTVATSRHVSVEVFDVLGRRVRVLHEGEVQPGERMEVALDGRGLPSGVYLVRASGDGLHLTRRVTLVQ